MIDSSRETQKEAIKEISTTGRRLRGAILQLLGRAILSGDYQPGDIIPGELAHATDLRVSRGAYREAVGALIAKGLVESRTKVGTRVLPRNRWNLLDPDVLGWAFSGEPDLRLIRSLFELREAIEPFAARLAAERRSKADLKKMKEALAQMQRLTLATEAGRAADRAFHEAILEASQNDALITLSSGVAAAISWTTQFKQRTHALPRDPIPDHRRVFDAIAVGDPIEAAQTMAELVRLALEDTWLEMGRLTGSDAEEGGTARKGVLRTPSANG